LQSLLVNTLSNNADGETTPAQDDVAGHDTYGSLIEAMRSGLSSLARRSADPQIALFDQNTRQHPSRQQFFRGYPTSALDQNGQYVQCAAAELDLIVALHQQPLSGTARTDRTTKHARGLMALDLSGDRHRPAHPEAVSP
jgi:hypothetical protein